MTDRTFLYAYQTGDAHCVSFETADPAAAAAAYIDESEDESGEVFVIVGDVLEEYLVDGDDAELVEGHRAPGGWTRGSVLPAEWRTDTGWVAVTVTAHPTPGGRRVEVHTSLGVRDYYGPDTIAAAYARTTTAEAEAVLRMAAWLAFGGGR